MTKFSWPIYFKDRLIVSNLNSSIAIVSLWTPKEFVAKQLDKSRYCVIGQLYTKKGINYLLRNILAKPTINTIYVVGNDLMDSGQTLIDFVNGTTNFTVEAEISNKAIKAFQSNVKVVDLRGADNIKTFASNIKPQKTCKPWRKPEVFDEPKPLQLNSFPSEIGTKVIYSSSIPKAYVSVLKHINLFGLKSAPMMGYVSTGSQTMKEILNLITVIDEQDDKFDVPSFMPFSKVDLEKYLASFFEVDRQDEDYTYGERLFNFAKDEIDKLKEVYPWLKIGRFQRFFANGGIDQVAISIVRKLSKFPQDKGAIALLGNPFVDVFPKRPPSKTPCLFLIQCQIYRNGLNLTAYFRSNDMYNAWPLNAFALRKLQLDIAQKLHVKVGSLITISNMAHVYEHNYTDAEQIVKNNDKPGCMWDKRGNFHVSVENNKVVVKLATPRSNEYIRQWRIDATTHKASQKLCYQIFERDLAASTVGNISDVSRQIERAVISVLFGVKYTQDNQLHPGGE